MTTTAAHTNSTTPSATPYVRELEQVAAVIAALRSIKAGGYSGWAPYVAPNADTAPWMGERDYALIAGPDHMLIKVSDAVSHGSETPSGQWHIRGLYSRLGDVQYDDYGYVKERAAINVSSNKEATTIARDIARRFLPVYERELAGVAANQQKRLAYHATRKEAYERLCRVVAPAATPRPYDPTAHRAPDVTLRLADGPGAYNRLTVEPHGDGTVEMRGTLPLELALEVLALLKAL